MPMSMEKIAELSAAANVAGMTYGQYMMQRERSDIPPRRHIPVLKRCERCGLPMDFKGARKYCPDCRINARLEINRKYYYRRKESGNE